MLMMSYMLISPWLTRESSFTFYTSLYAVSASHEETSSRRWCDQQHRRFVCFMSCLCQTFHVYAVSPELCVKYVLCPECVCRMLEVIQMPNIFVLLRRPHLAESIIQWSGIHPSIWPIGILAVTHQGAVLSTHRLSCIKDSHCGLVI